MSRLRVHRANHLPSSAWKARGIENIGTASTGMPCSVRSLRFSHWGLDLANGKCGTGWTIRKSVLFASAAKR